MIIVTVYHHADEDPKTLKRWLVQEADVEPMCYVHDVPGSTEIGIMNCEDDFPMKAFIAKVCSIEWLHPALVGITLRSEESGITVVSIEKKSKKGVLQDGRKRHNKQS